MPQATRSTAQGQQASKTGKTYPTPTAQ